MTTTKRTYENLYIIDINSTDEQIQSIADKFSGIVTEQGGEVIAAGLWDKRKLAYSIKGKNEGCYLLMYFTGEASVCTELDRVMRISDDIIRHMILNIEPQYVDVSLIRKPGTEAPAAPAAVVQEVVEEEAAADDTAVEEAVVEEQAEEAPVAEEPVAEAEPVSEPASEE